MTLPVSGKSGKDNLATRLENDYEKRPDPVSLTQNPDPSQNSSTGVDYEPHPEHSIKLEPDREKIVQSICNLYSGSASKEDMMVYAKEAVYDDPWSYCDTRYKIAGQWYGIPKIMKYSRTIKTEIVSSKPDEIIFKLQQEYTPKPMPVAKKVNSLVTLTLDGEGKRLPVIVFFRIVFLWLLIAFDSYMFTVLFIWPSRAYGELHDDTEISPASRVPDLVFMRQSF
ncbi:hypothetical protein TW65_07245 [Stemphylium lycopersici]|uniref:Uncharacterized protein n=1 Tax=Stemphylium lycopersici TaxID=183478 RepID=A0A364MZE0_STELY|nr:hypothetical protein TW65_07245 [Stemphylium lycopersici]RAR07761.1 hypothetical protein DDE83_006328 [Stemphylium lycopersici]